MECHGSVDSAKSEPVCLFISVGEPELQDEGQHNYVRVKGRSSQRCESGDHGRGARGLPEQGRKMDPLAPLTGQSAQLRSTGTSREVAGDHEAPSQTNAAAKAARALGGGSRECHYSKLRRGRPEAEARAYRQQRGEATAWLAQFSGRDEDHGARSQGSRAEQRPTQGADRRLRCRPSRQQLQLGGVPGDAHKRTRHGTVETTTMPRIQLPSSGRSKGLAHAGMDQTATMTLM